MILPIPGASEVTQFEQDYLLAVGKPAPKPPGHPVGVAPVTSTGLRVDISHEFFTDILVITWEGQSEEKTHVELLQWLREHGAKDEEKMNESINCALNFGRSVFTIKDAKKPQYKQDPADPVI